LGRDTRAKRVAEERIEILFEEAVKTYPQNPSQAQRYVDLARRIGMRYRVRLPRGFRRLVCRRCKGFMLPGYSCRVRVRSRGQPHVAITCLSCGAVTRIPLRGRQPEKPSVA